MRENRHSPYWFAGIRTLALAGTVAVALITPRVAQAQLPGIVRQGLGFLNTGGYFFTGNAGGSGSLGTPKFFSAGGFYARPHHIGRLAISAGLESVNASDHFLPFTGGNEFNLLGGGVRLSTDRYVKQVIPVVTLGLFAGRLRSVNQGFDRTEFTPSGSIGLEYAISRNFSLTASYRISQNIHHVNTDGFGISLKVL